MRSFIAIALVLTVCGVAVAQPPAGFPPTLKVVASVDPAKGKIEFRDIVIKHETVTEFRVEVKNGAKINVPYTVLKQVPVEVVIAIDATASRIITADGKQLPIDEVWKRVKAKTVVAMSGDGKTPDPAYLNALNPETLIIIPGMPKSK